MKHGIIAFLLMTVLFVSCNNDDDGTDIVVEPPRSLAEVAIENDAEIQAFLDTHFYNYEEFENPPAGFDYRIKIDTIAGENADKEPLNDMDELKSIVINVSSFEHQLTEEETNVPHKLYYLSAREGVGVSPTVADSVFVRYEGKLLNRSTFDASLNTPIWFDLARLQDLTQGFRGFSEGVPQFKAGGNIIENGDGTVTVEDYGVGMIIFPSGLANFNNPQGTIPRYSPLIFLIDLFTMNESDHDNDGIPSIMEDVNGNGYLYDDNTDVQSEEDAGLAFRFANFLDPDDDGDGTSTRDEISDGNGSVVGPPYPDSNSDGTPDHLDPDTN